MTVEELLAKPAPILMGILNCTPDSFSDGGQFDDFESAKAQVERLSSDGADIIDIGGESTGPGSKAISAEEELQRIKALIENCKDYVLSVDTYKASVADQCLSTGAKIINDVSAMRADPEMASVVAQHKAYVVLMFSKEEDSSPHASTKEVEYDDVIDPIKSFLHQRIEFSLKAGISSEKIILDPSMGKFVSHADKYSWEILSRFDELTREFADFPFLIGTSRKGFLGGEISQRDPISQLTAFTACCKGARIVRTHNVKLAQQLSDSLI